MKRMRRAARAASRKWKSRSGESIAETLVALLIAAVALVMLASMITSSSRLITRSKKMMTEYYTANDALAAQGTSGTVGSVRLTAEGEGGSTVTVKKWENVSYASNTVVNKSIVAYWQEPAPAGGEP